MVKLKSFVIASFTFFSLVTPALAHVPGVDPTMEAATKGIVAVAHPLAAEVGKEVLANGGNAVDAAAAIQLSLTVVEPMMSGIGGGGFLMVYLKDQNKITIIDSREMAPKDVTPSYFLGEDGKPIPWFERHTSGKAVGVPGTLKGVEVALEKYGTKKLAEVIQPAIDQAEKGITVNWSMAQYIGENADKLKQYGTAAEVFYPGGVAKKEGDFLVQPDLAKTLKLIQEKGTDVFYKGEVGAALVAEVQKHGGTMTIEDLNNYVVKEREPVVGEYRGYQIASMSPPSSGGLTVLQILQLMEGYDVKKMGVNSADYLHRLIEAMHLAYADRAAYMADEDFYPVPKKGLIDKAYIDERRQLINPAEANAVVKEGNPWKYEDEDLSALAKVKEKENPTGETTHFSVMDQWGNLVSYTTTIEAVFGSGIMVPGYGFMLNNEMTDFDATPGGVNQVEPGKRPRSSMSPTLVIKDGQPFMALGSPGGPTIITSVAQTIMNVIDHDLNIQDAILTPRIYSSNYPDVRWESGIDQDVILELLGKGHRFEATPQNIGNVQAVMYDFETGKMYGGADNTREGTVLGVDVVKIVMDKPKATESVGKGAYTLKVNGLAYPFMASQLHIQNGMSYVEAGKLLLGLGAEAKELAVVPILVNGVEFLPVRVVAEGLGYKVSWNNEDRAVLLEKEKAKTTTPVQNYYSEDKFKITN